MSHSARAPGRAEAREIGSRLRRFQHDVGDPSRFEVAVAQACQLLGLHAEPIRGGGCAVIEALHERSNESFAVILEGKTCPPGACRCDIDFDHIEALQRRHGAHAAVVVAAAFESNDAVSEARARGIGLLTTEQLVQLVEAASQGGLAHDALRHVLSQPGPIHFAPADHCPQQRMARAVAAVLRIYAHHPRSRDDRAYLSRQAVVRLSKARGDDFTEAQLGHALDFLASPVLGVLEACPGGYALAIPLEQARASLARVSEALGGCAES